MKRTIIFYLLICLFFASSCGDKHLSKTLVSFVGNYDIYDNIILQQTDLQCAVIGIHKAESVFQTYGTKEQRSKFKEISVKNGDISYNTKVEGVGVLSLFSVAYPNVVSVKVSSLEDYSSIYPANSSLAGITRFMSWGVDPFIRSGYKKVFTYSQEAVSSFFANYVGEYYTPSSYRQFFGTPSIKPCFPIDCLVKDLRSDDLKMLINFAGTNGDAIPRIGYLYFEELPDVPGDYDIKVEITDENGKVYTSTLTMKFDF